MVSIENGTNEFNLYNDSYNKNTETDTYSEIQCLTGLDEFRRKSVEDYLDMSNSVLSPIALNTKNRKTLLRKEKTKQLKIKRQIESELKIESEQYVPVPPAPRRPIVNSNYSSSQTEDASIESNNILDLGEYQNRLFYEGSIDYWEQYDPELIQNSGFAIITTDETKDSEDMSALCFLCGSQGKYFGFILENTFVRFN